MSVSSLVGLLKSCCQGGGVGLFFMQDPRTLLKVRRCRSVKHKSRQPGSFTRDRNCRRRSVTLVKAEAGTSMVAPALGDGCWTRYVTVSAFSSRLVVCSIGTESEVRIL